MLHARGAYWNSIWRVKPLVMQKFSTKWFNRITRGTEFGDWGFMPTDPDELRSELETRNLTMLGAFVPAALVDPGSHQKGLDLALKTAKLLAAVNESPYIVLADDNGTVENRTKKAGRIQPEDGLTDEQWTRFRSRRRKNRKVRKRRNRRSYGIPPSLRRICRNAVRN